jgi:hypothetical protein
VNSNDECWVVLGPLIYTPREEERNKNRNTKWRSMHPRSSFVAGNLNSCFHGNLINWETSIVVLFPFVVKFALIYSFLFAADD